MKKTVPKSTAPARPLPKCPTGIQGLDEITGGGAQLSRAIFQFSTEPHTP